MSKTHKKLPILYAKNKNGVWKEWSVEMIHEGGDHNPPQIVVRHGQHGGKMIIDKEDVVALKRGYNGLWEQAVAMGQSKWNHKRNRENYREEMSGFSVGGIIMPMLAKTFEGGKHLVFPLCVQPKIDGVRCLACWEEGMGVMLRTRTGCELKGLSDIKKELGQTYFCKDGNTRNVLDGELYSDDMPFEELNGYCRRQKESREEDMKRVVYNVFDVILPEPVGFRERMRHFPIETCHTKLVPTFDVETMEDAIKYMDQFIKEGYEGIMMRNGDGIYRIGHRSWDLQKYKLFQEDEFKIIGYTEGKGREKGKVVWQCETKNGKMFHARPKGDHCGREWMFKNASSFVGKMLTVVFQEYSRDGIPRFPVAKAIRQNY